MAQGKKYTDEERLAITEEVCRRLIEGETLRGICGDPEMPAKSTFLHWQFEEQSQQGSGIRTIYARAREIQADALDDEMAHLTACMLAGELDHNSVRVALNNMQWRAMRKNPKRYGDRLEAHIAGDITVIVDKVEQ